MLYKYGRSKSSSTQSMTLRYWFMLAVLALAALLSHNILVTALDSQKSGASIINLSVRQRFLIERLFQYGWRLVETRSDEAREIWRTGLQETIRDISDRHDDLVSRIYRSQSRYGEARNILFESPGILDSKLRSFLQSACNLAEVPDDQLSSDNIHLQRMNVELMPVVQGIDQLTSEFERDIEQGISKTMNMSLLVLILAVFLLFWMGFFVFHPVVERVREEIKLLTDNEELTRSIVYSSLDGVVIWDHDCIVREWNPQAEQIFGWKREEILGKSITDTIIPPAHRHRFDAKKLGCQKEDDHDAVLNRRFEITALRKSGAEFPVELTITRIFREGQTFYSAYIRDIFEIKIVQRELNRYREHLEELLDKKGKELEESYKQMKISERLAAIGELAAKVAHEIKNPLAGIRGSVRILTRDLPEDSPKKEVVQDVMQEIQRLDDTVNDLLAFARPLTVKMRSVEVAVFLDEMRDSWKIQPDLSSHQIEVFAEKGLFVELDLRLINQTLYNLVLNAAQAMKQPGKVTITARRVNHAVEIIVSDTGPGIPENVMPSLFVPFYTTKSRGTGLGLAISRKNIEAMNGSLTVTSVPGQGARFTITLPAESGSMAQSERP